MSYSNDHRSSLFCFLHAFFRRSLKWSVLCDLETAKYQIHSPGPDKLAASPGRTDMRWFPLISLTDDIRSELSVSVPVVKGVDYHPSLAICVWAGHVWFSSL